MLRKLGMLALVLFLNAPVQAQVAPAPSTLNLQGRLTTPSGNPVSDGAYSIRFSLWNVASGGTVGTNEKWNKTVNNVLVKNGTFAVAFDTFPSGTFDSDLWLEIKVGNDAALTPRQPLASVAYAMKANTVPDGAIGANQLAANSVGNTKLVSDALSLGKISADMLSLSNSQLLYPNGVIKNTNANLATSDMGLYSQVTNRWMRFVTNGGNFAWYSDNGIGTTRLMQLHSSGNLTVNAYGNTFPAVGINANSNIGTWLQLNNTSTGGRSWNLISTGSNNGEGAGKLLFREQTSGNTYMTIDNSGYIGIGTFSPGMSLEVAKPSYYGGPSNGVAYSASHYAYLHGGAGDHSVIWNSDSAMRFGSEPIRGSGYVEHARITPPAADSTDQSQPTFPNIYTANLAVDPAQSFQPSRTGYITKLRVYTTANSGSGLITAYIFRGNTTSGTAMWVETFSNQSGAIGWKEYTVNPPLLVTANQTYTLWVRGGSQLQIGYATGNPYTLGASNIGANNDLAFETVMSNSGATNIKNALTIQTLASAPAGLNIANTNDKNYAIRLTNATTGLETGMVVTDTGFFQITNNINGGAFARLDSNGFWTSTSDRRLKSDIEPLGNLLDKALQLKPVSYYFKAQDKLHDPNRHIGFIAQDVEPIFPSLVAGTDTKTLNYTGLSVVAIGALQEMNRQMTQDRKRVESLEAENAQLKQRLEAIEAALAQRR